MSSRAEGQHSWSDLLVIGSFSGETLHLSAGLWRDYGVGGNLTFKVFRGFDELTLMMVVRYLRRILHLHDACYRRIEHSPEC